MSERMRWGSSLSGARRAKANSRKLSDQQRKTGAESGYDGGGLRGDGRMVTGCGRGECMGR